MLRNENYVDQKVKSFIEQLFAGVGRSQQLFDLKEELATNLKDKIGDYQARGMDEETAFKEAVITMGDLSGLVEDMRKLGQDQAKQSVYSTMTTRISTVGIVLGVMLVLFGIFVSAMLYFMNLEGEAVTGTGIFIVAGGILMTYSILTRETRKKYGMNKIRAILYAFSVGLILFGLFTASITKFSTGEIYISIASLMVFFISGVGLFLYLLLTGANRLKSK